MNSKLLSLLLVFAVGGAVFAADDIYVARENENASDEPCEGRGTQALPYKTIQAAVNAAGVGATVWVDEGVYADEPTTDPDGEKVRVAITNVRINLISLKGREKTHIVGAHGTGDHGHGEGAVRGIYVNKADVVIAGFTIRDCAVASTSKNGGGVRLAGTGNCLAQCIIENCVAQRGGGVMGGMSLGCWFRRNVCTEDSTVGGAALYNGGALNSLFTENRDLSTGLGFVIAYPGSIVGCTVAGNIADCMASKYSTSTYVFYNSVFADNRGLRIGTVNIALTNCAFKATTTAYNTEGSGLCKSDLADNAFLSPRTGDWRMTSAAGVEAVGDAKWLANISLPAAAEKYRYLDALGKAIPTSGAITCGAIQETVEAPCGALGFSETFAVDGAGDDGSELPPMANYMRPAEYPTMLKVKAAAVNDTNLVYYSYGKTVRPPRQDGWICIVPPPTGSETLTPNYATAVVYADAVNGNDAWDGSAATHEADTLIGPKKTLQAAVDATPAGTGGITGTDKNAKWSLVIAAKGTYDEGGAVSSAVALSNRVCITGNRRVRILAKEGPKKTLIVGAPDPLSQGLGPNAMRCVAIEVPSVVQGFTLTGGYTDDSETESNATRAGGVCGNSSADRIAADCIITNNFAGHGAGIRYARAYRCRIWGNSTSRSDGSSRSAVLVSSLLGGQRGNVDCLVGGGSTCYNTTIVGEVNTATGSTSFYDVLIDSPSVAHAVTAVGCYSRKGFGSTSGAADCSTGPVEFVDEANGDCRLPVDSLAFGQGKASMETIYKFACEDLEGNFMKFADGATVPGAFQRPADVLNLTVNVPEGGQVTVSGGVVGRNVLADGATVTVANDTACGRNCLGFEVDGAFVAGPSYTYVSPDRGTVSNRTVTAVYSTDWYVNPDSTVGDDANDGFTPETPKRTLKGAMSAAVVAGDTVHAAKGVYREEEMKQTDKCAAGTVLADVIIMNRVAVPSGVTLLADEGPEKTAIEGRSATDPDEHGLGTDAVRCVFLAKGASVRGFTIRNGRSRAQDGSVDDAYAGGILGCGSAEGTVENCIITNCVAYRGGAGHSLTFLNCRIFDNTGVERGAVSRLSSFYGCIIDRCTGSEPVDYFTTISNCTFGTQTSVTLGNAQSGSRIYDSIILCDIGLKVENVYRSAYLTTSTSRTFDGCLRVQKAFLQLDADYAPVLGANVAIDKVPLADEPAADEVDCYGRQRVYNGARDLGAVDADWRGVYAKALGRGLTVETASPYAVTNEAGRVFLPKGELTVAWGREEAPEAVHRLQAHVTGAGVLSATLNDAAEPFATVTKGDPVELSQKVAGRNTFAFDYAPGQDDGGGAELFGFKRDIGLLLLVR